jgi:signal transduction histidine kinase
MRSNYKRHVLIALVVVALVPMLVTALYLVFVTRGSLYRSVTERLITTASYRRSELENWVEGLTGTLYREVVTLDGLPKALEELQPARLNPQLNARLDAALQNGFAEVMLLTRNTLQYSTDPTRSTVPPRTCPEKSVCASQLFRESGRPPYLVVEYPILERGGTYQVGSVVGLVDTRVLDSILRNRAGLGDAGVAYLVNVNGAVHWLPDMAAQQSLPPPGVIRLDQTVRVIDAGEYRGVMGEAVVGVTAHVPRLFAWVVVETPTRELFAFSNAVLLLFIGLACVMFGLIWLLCRWLFRVIDQPQRVLAAEARDVKMQLGKAHDAEQRRSRAIADMGHELRTPINSILNFSGFLNDGLFGSLTSDQADMIKQIHGSSQHLLEMVNDLIDMSQIEAGQMKLFVQEYDPAPLFEQAIGTLHSLILDKPIKVITDLPRQWPAMRGDRRRVLQILLNLVSNAAKFTEQGTITLRAHTYSTRLEVRIEDTGVGIDPAALPNLFEPFHMGTNSRAHEKGGTGLGLHLSRYFARLHGGDLTHQPTGEHARSNGKSGGAIFVLSLPIDAIEEQVSQEMSTKN